MYSTIRKQIFDLQACIYVFSMYSSIPGKKICGIILVKEHPGYNQINSHMPTNHKKIEKKNLSKNDNEVLRLIFQWSSCKFDEAR